jgi:hypothetical protein
MSILIMTNLTFKVVILKALGARVENRSIRKNEQTRNHSYLPEKFMAMVMDSEEGTNEVILR